MVLDLGPAASISLENLLEIQILSPYSRLRESETKGGAQQCVLTRLQVNVYILTFENHCPSSCPKYTHQLHLRNMSIQR